MSADPVVTNTATPPDPVVTELLEGLTLSTLDQLRVRLNLVEAEFDKFEALTPEQAPDLLRTAKNPQRCKGCFKPTTFDTLSIRLAGEVLEVRWTCRSCHTYNRGDLAMRKIRRYYVDMLERLRAEIYAREVQ